MLMRLSSLVRFFDYGLWNLFCKREWAFLFPKESERTKIYQRFYVIVFTIRNLQFAICNALLFAKFSRLWLEEKTPEELKGARE
jgi:hypothetical protein